MADYSGGTITSDAGGMLLREVDEILKIVKNVSEAFTDSRYQRFVEHPLESMLKQIIYGLCLG